MGVKESQNQKQEKKAQDVPSILAKRRLLPGDRVLWMIVVMYLLNDWIPKGGIGIFTLIFVLGYAAVWLVIYLSIRIKTAQINKKLHS